MPTYRISTPDGAQFDVSGDDDAQTQAAINKLLQEHGAKAGFDPTEGMSAVDKLFASIGSGAESTSRGIAQLGNKLGALPMSPDERALFGAKNDAAINENAKLDAPLVEHGIGKVGNIIGGAIPTLPLMAIPGGGGWGAVAGKGMLAGGLGAAMQPVVGGPEDFGTEKAKQVATGTALGGLIGPALKAGGVVAENLLPSNATAQVLNWMQGRANQSPFAAEGESLAAQTGVRLTPGQVSGSKAMNAAENAARQSVFSRDVAFQGDRARVQALSDYLDRTAEGITKSNASPEAAGAAMQSATKSALAQLKGWRDKTAAEDYGAIRALTNGSAEIQPEASASLLQQMVNEYGGVGAPGADALAAFAKKQLANISPAAKQAAANPSQLVDASGNLFTTPAVAAAQAAKSAPAQGNLDKLMGLRSYLSKVAGGEAKISGDPVDKKIARDLLGAIDQDIEKAGDTIGGDLGGMLKQANARYREVSQQIESVKLSPLGRILGEDVAGAFQSGQFNTIAPEAVFQKLNSLKPSELGVVRGMMEVDNPQAWQTFKRGVLEDALDKARAIPPSEGANTMVLRPNVLVKTIGDRKKLEAVFGKSELDDIQRGLDVATRLADKTGWNFSGTAAQSELLGVMNSLKNVTATTAMSAGGQVLGSRALAKLMTNSDGRAALMQLARLPPGSAKAAQIVTQLGSIIGADELTQPQGTGQQ